METDQAELFEELSRRVYEELDDKTSMMPLRQWLDDKERRSSMRGYDREIGPYYIVPLSVFEQCGIDEEEFFYGKTTHHKHTFERKHQCWKCDKIHVYLDGESVCDSCREEK
mgnify:FL=1